MATRLPESKNFHFYEQRISRFPSKKNKFIGKKFEIVKPRERKTTGSRVLSLRSQPDGFIFRLLSRKKMKERMGIMGSGKWFGRSLRIRIF
jgi:hypothetical protein